MAISVDKAKHYFDFYFILKIDLYKKGDGHE